MFFLMPRLVVSQIFTGFSNMLHLIQNSGQLKSSSIPELETVLDQTAALE